MLSVSAAGDVSTLRATTRNFGRAFGQPVASEALFSGGIVARAARA